MPSLVAGRADASGGVGPPTVDDGQTGRQFVRVGTVVCHGESDGFGRLK
jgi:hypothetical protein